MHELEQIIKDEINSSINKEISFYQFMNLALYHKEYGYYMKQNVKIGREGDFYTNSSVGDAFGKTFAKVFIELWNSIKVEKFVLFEYGAGNGQFAKHVLDFLKSQDHKVYNNLMYIFIEVSPYHRLLQKEQLKDHLSHVKWVEKIEDCKEKSGIIFSNELLDSFPVHVVEQKEDGIYEVMVTVDEKGNFVEKLVPAKEEITWYLAKFNIELLLDQRIEINLDSLDWLKKVSEQLTKGFVVTVDYGHLADELYASYRMKGTLLSYYQHKTNEEFFLRVGEQDLTSHVNFSSLQVWGQENNLRTIAYLKQAIFLLNSGILDYINDDRSMRTIRHLIMPYGLGETFKVLVQAKNVDEYNYSFLNSAWEKLPNNHNLNY